MADTTYQPLSFIFQSKGIVARWATDRAPQFCYLNLNNAEERQETALSSRYGCVIINRDPDGTPGGTNYLLPNPIVTITRLAQKSSDSSWRYAGDNTGVLYRRTGDTQGPYTQIITGLSGQPFDSVVNTTFGSSTPYIFIADANLMLKDNGAGTPTKWGIAPPTEQALTWVFDPQVFLIDGFNNGAGGYAVSNVTGLASGTIGTVTTSLGGGSFGLDNAWEYYTVTGGLKFAWNGCLATFGASGAITSVAILSAITTTLVGSSYTLLQVTTASAHGLSVGNGVQIAVTSNPYFDGIYLVHSVLSPTVFTVSYGTPTYASASGGVMYGALPTASQALLFNIYGAPKQQQFTTIGVGGVFNNLITSFPIDYVGGSVAASTIGTIGKTVSLDLSQANQAIGGDLIAVALSIGTPENVVSVQIEFDINGSGYTSAYYSAVVPITPATAGTSAWQTYYIPMGNFVANGMAGQQNYTWADVTGWRVVVTTNSTGGTTVSLNALYQQWGYGPSSFGGTGYDYRYTYYRADTQTESNGSPIQAFDQQAGYVASQVAPFSLRQALRIQASYSQDPQVTHVRFYRRGGTLSSNWFLIDQVPNNSAGGQFNYFDLIADADIQQANTLKLANNVPVTSTLPIPISTTLAQPTAAPTFLFGASTPFDVFQLQNIVVANSSAVFLPGQIVDIGKPYNLEQVSVIAGGTGSFFSIVRLMHNAGEPVQVFAIQGQPCDLCALAYGQMWVAGDPNNPHFLYFSNPGYPENFGPQNYIPVSEPSDPIMAVINFRGTLFVATLTTWYQIIGGASPYAQPTGSKHGLVAKHGWTQTESAVWYQAIDGIRAFRGADGMYASLIIEWLYRQVPQAYTPIPLVNLGSLSTIQMAFQNNFVYAMYPAYNGNNYRLAFSTEYQRWRNDDVNATALYFEEDTNNLLYTKFLTAGAQSGYAICIDRVNDYDDGGWVSGALAPTPIAANIRIPYHDLEKPHFPKQWNTLELDVDTKGQNMTVLLHVDDDAQILNLGTVNTASRDKVQLKINAGDGVQGYKVSPEFQASVTVAPNIWQLDIYYALLAAYRTSFDSYWIKFGTDESKLVKEGYFDYTSTTSITVSLYADGGTAPYYSFVLPANPNRQSEPVRVRFAPIKLRMFRCIATSSAPFQVWANLEIRWKSCRVGTGYATMPLVI